ncbi:hypothetical protein ACFPPD_05470 [Cohnella suwonensis]|uniref:Uncharacterized protein n=1 Tax=Cohnella suwonensis TaxID=696072 RepID=A0ABW0LT53_9BACL
MFFRDDMLNLDRKASELWGMDISEKNRKAEMIEVRQGTEVDLIVGDDAIVLSPKAFNDTTGFVSVCPITHTVGPNQKSRLASSTH